MIVILVGSSGTDFKSKVFKFVLLFVEWFVSLLNKAGFIARTYFMAQSFLVLKLSILYQDKILVFTNVWLPNIRYDVLYVIKKVILQLALFFMFLFLIFVYEFLILQLITPFLLFIVTKCTIV